MSNIIRLPRDPHHETRTLLPWYVAGALEPGERARVDAHLAGCPACRAELVAEQRLKGAVAELPVGVEHGWAQMRRRIEADERRPAARLARLSAAARGWFGSPGAWVGWGLAASLGAVLAAGSLAPRQPPAAYHALSAAPAARPAGNLIVVFRPDATEQAISAALASAGARIVDGPTSADAYVLSAPARERALASLHASGAVAMAEPIEDGASP